ncbi:hypothetical protein [Halomonas rhizosphaerae]|uniref:Integrase n=1 Tax=Halomonas rhizosphaerae TaxID=3043296 RepID=A0ABT6UU72_9GAMM|nr:hypothetical protein [Halomonas rhizosphaerae]MDI5889501.1 hypothetical protein [Halomonas rhizosphaerae]
MINMTDELVIVQRGDQLEETIRLSINETVEILKVSYNIKSDVKPYQVTAGRENQLKELAFLRYIPPFSKIKHTEEWLVEFYKLVCSGGRRGYVSKIDSGKLSHLINEGEIPETLCNPLIRGMRFFFLCLWKNRAVLLTMNFVLPSTKRDSDPARIIYPDLLYAARSPMMKGDVDNDRSLIPYLKHTAYKNVYWYYWRPIVCSDWHVIEDVSNEDLITYFEEIRRRNENGTKKTSYPVSSSGFLGVLYKKYGDRCKFDIGKVSKFNPRAERSTKDLGFEVDVFATNTDFSEQKDSWLNLEKSYMKLLEKQYSRSKLKQAGQSISKLNAYLFTVLPQAGGSPPYPKDFNRRFLDGIEYPSMTDETIVNTSLFVNLQQFFNHIESVSESFYGAEGFTNPLLKLDKPREKKRQATNKKTFSIDDFRFIYEIVYSISEMSWHINSTIADGVGLNYISSGGVEMYKGLSQKIKSVSDLVYFDNANWHIRSHVSPTENLNIQKVLRANIFENTLRKNSNRSVVDMEEFGYVPFISYQRFSDDKILMVPLKFIPTKVLKVISVQLKGATRYSPFLAMQNINQIVAALETGLRHITIRWLDKKTYRHGDVDENKVYFNLHVNSDKVQNSWIRPTSKKLLQVLDRQVESHKWIDDDLVNHEINYNYEKNTRHGRIYPVFIRYDKKEVYGEQVVSNYYNSLMCFVSLVKIAIGEAPLESIGNNIKALKLSSKEGFESAWKNVDTFKSRFTPHGTRASVVSIMSTALPADIIGQFITGHVSVDTVRYYISVNIDMMSQMGLINDEETQNKVQKVLALITPLKIHADSRDSKIRRLLTQGNESISTVMNDFGGCSFSQEMDDKYVSGIDEIRSVDRSQLAFLPTHICPLENECPRSIKASIGEKQCGQCPYSVKTVDHLPGIQAKCRYLARELDATKKIMKNHKKNNGEGEQSEVIQKKYMKMASELAAWTLTERILRTNYEQLKDKVLVNKPELLMGAVEEREVPVDWLSKLLIECEDAVAYPELSNSTLEANVLRCRTRIVASKNELAEYYGENDDYDPVEGFRHHVRAFCLATGKAPSELVSYVENNETKSLLTENAGMSSSNLIPKL